MSLAPGSRIGPYEIIASIGAGGMGEVYRGRDHKLGRDVAIKILPANVAADPERLARFEREARMLAAFNHPNIAQVFGFEDGALIMELLEGETLRDRLRNGALPARKAIEYATQMARGLAAAHDRGIIHRDLKPDNIFLLKDGQIKLLDFGLARPMTASSSGASATITAAIGTDPGTVMGTVGYMSPEQVRAEPVDARTDLFSLGAVLYEMLTGERAFRRNTNAETMTAILREDPPDLSSARADISPAIDRIVRHAIEKNPLERFQTARDIAFALDSLSGSTSSPFAAAPARSPITRERLAWIALTAALAAGAIWLGFGDRQQSGEASASYQLNLALPDEIRTADAVLPLLRLGVSADGSSVAYAGIDSAGQRRLWIVSLRTGAVRALDEAGYQPAFSPDGSELVYSLRQPGGVVSRKMPFAGGPAETIAAFGGLKAWSPSGKLMISPPILEAQLVDMSSARTGTKKLGAIYGMTSAMPDGRFLASMFKGSDVDAVYVRSVDSNDATRLIDGAAAAWYSNGTVAFVKDQTVFGQRFDERRTMLVGEPVTITKGIEQTITGGLAIAGSVSGTLVLQRPEQRERSQLKWFRRDGTVAAIVGEASDYSNTELSPDGRRLLVSITEPNAATRDLYIVDLQRGVRQRFTFDPGDERSGVWSADGLRVFYRAKNFDLYVKRADFAGKEEPFVIDGYSKDPYSVSPDGKFLVYRVSGTAGSNDVMVVPVDGKSPPTALQNTAFNEAGGSFSPDGKSIVYQSDESGQTEVYVMAVGGGGRVQLSTNGGGSARWVRNGTEIFYLSLDHMLMSVPVRGSGSSFEAGAPQKMFVLDAPVAGGVPYDVTADGQRIIAINPVEATTRPRLTAIINWPALVPK